MKSKIVIFLFLFSILTTKYCSDDPVSPKSSGFDNHEEYLENPSVKDAIDDSGIEIYEGNDPPVLSGEYIADAEITDVSPEIYYMEGATINSNITLYNQTNTGKIQIREKIGSITVFGSGGFITGDNNQFTIWQESEQSGDETGLPDDITINVALLISGYKDSDGDLHVEGMSIISKVDTDNDDYDVDSIKGLWWMYEGIFYLQGPANLSIQNFNSSNTINTNIDLVKIVINKSLNKIKE